MFVQSQRPSSAPQSSEQLPEQVPAPALVDTLQRQTRQRSHSAPPTVHLPAPTAVTLGSDNLAAVPSTALLVAAMRAVEMSLPADMRRVNDPFAAKLAGERGFKLMNGMFKAFRASYAKLGVPVKDSQQLNFLPPRAAYFDTQLLKVLADNPALKQVVTLGSGMDTRAYRLDIPSDVKMFEVDYADVHAYKAQKLKGDSPSCQRIAVNADMAVDDWSALLKQAGLDSAKPTVWIAEGLMYYIPKDQIAGFIKRVDDLSVPGCTFMFDGFDNYDLIAQRLSDVEAWFNAQDVYFTSSSPDTKAPLEAAGWSEANAVIDPMSTSRYSLQKI